MSWLLLTIEGGEVEVNGPEFQITRVKCLVRVPLRLKLKLWLKDRFMGREQRRLKQEIEYQLDYEFLFGGTSTGDTVPRKETR